ncbi:putative receptor-like protein kinase At4g00960 [Tripterygium wilfordii]|uniref:putative receptor-like protein kinase At4g00960 n=1 Tax=Tripterygium wilfordii TaxID=458696 RepID=UPI0018F863CF|nr:putative receptor-like protein kinase At4g00960 [Tripterygium wilfordii]
MPSSVSMFFLACFLFILNIVDPTVAQTEIMLYKDCLNKGNYTPNGTYQSNLDRLLTSIYTNNEIDYGFYNFSYGETPEKVYSIALCRPDITPDVCRECIRNASEALTTICPKFMEAVGGYDLCILRYANRNIFNLMEGGPYFWVYSLFNVSDVAGFNRSVFTLLDRLGDQAATGNSQRKYAVGELAGPNLQPIYALVQCTPDLSQEECKYCLYNASALIPKCCTERQGGRVIFPSCNFRYETNRFYNAIVDAALPPSSTSKGKESQASKTVIIIVIPVMVFVVSVIVMIFIYLRVQKTKTEFTIDEIETVESLQYDFSFIRAATDNFSEANKLGQGGFGPVYKGTFPNKQEVAVKRLSKESSQGEVEFKNEVLLLAKLQHRNLVRLIGFCYERNERLLIYEFVPNSSLNNFLSDHTKRAQLDWESRYNIIYGIVRGLIYLHEESQHRIIHRDLKTSNILLDASMNAKISDFGTARLFAIDQTQDDTSRIVGTYGYMAPEYVANGHFSAKSDVYSFGVIVLEVVSGQKNRSFRVGEEIMDLKTYAWQSWNQGTALNLIDPILGGEPTSEMMQCIHIGLLCIQEDEASRPTMASIGVMLTNYAMNLPQPSKPAFFMGSTLNRWTSSSLERNSESIAADKSNTEIGNLSRNEASITELDPR